MNSKLYFLILSLLLIWGCAPSKVKESVKDIAIIKIDNTKLNDTKESLNNEQDNLKNKDLKLDSSIILPEEIRFSYSSIGKDQFRLDLENGHIQKKVINTQKSGHFIWETFDNVNISYKQSYQLCALLKPKYDDNCEPCPINLFVLINKSNGEVFYKDQDAKQWKFIPTKNLKVCNNCYSFDFRYNINSFEVLEAINDNTGEIFNLIGHKAIIPKRQSWIWEKGEKKYLISKNNPWLYPKDNFEKLERG